MDKPEFALEAEDVHKTFGHFTALAGLTLRVRRGEFLALFGRNGAGKTTFLKIVSTLMRPTRGTLRIQGFDLKDKPEKVRREIGLLSHNTYVYRDLSAMENLRFFCRLYGVPDSDERILSILDRVGLRKRAKHPVRSFSRGLQQRVGIARVLLHDPSLILLDEPYTGLDANAAAILNEILDEAVAAGNTVILTTHDIEQGLRGASRAVIVDRGKVVFDGDAHGREVRQAYDQYIRIGVGR